MKVKLSEQIVHGSCPSLVTLTLTGHHAWNYYIYRREDLRCWFATHLRCLPNTNSLAVHYAFLRHNCTILAQILPLRCLLVGQSIWRKTSSQNDHTFVPAAEVAYPSLNYRAVNIEKKGVRDLDISVISM